MRSPEASADYSYYAHELLDCFLIIACNPFICKGRAEIAYDYIIHIVMHAMQYMIEYERILNKERVVGYDLIFSPALIDLQRVRAYHELFREELALLDRSYWIDAVLYPRLKGQYDRLLGLFGLDLKSSQLTTKSRHSFFIFDEKLGLSGLQMLLGYQVATPSKEEPKIDGNEITGTGDAVLDTLVAMQSSGWNAGWYAEKFSLDQVTSMLEYYWALKSPDESKSPEQDKEFVGELMDKNPEAAKIIEQGRVEAKQSLLMTKGFVAKQISDMEKQLNGSSSSQRDDSGDSAV